MVHGSPGHTEPINAVKLCNTPVSPPPRKFCQPVARPIYTTPKRQFPYRQPVEQVEVMQAVVQPHLPRAHVCHDEVVVHVLRVGHKQQPAVRPDLLNDLREDLRKTEAQHIAPRAGGTWRH